MACLTRVERLAAYLAQAARTPFDWESFDCAAGFAGRWVEQERGIDPAAELRGTYRGPLQACRLLNARGGLLAVVSRQAEASGIETTTSPVLGDVGLVWAMGRRRAVEVMAIRTARRWAFLTPRGLAAGPAEAVRAWSI